MSEKHKATAAYLTLVVLVAFLGGAAPASAGEVQPPPASVERGITATLADFTTCIPALALSAMVKHPREDGGIEYVWNHLSGVPTDSRLTLYDDANQGHLDHALLILTMRKNAEESERGNALTLAAWVIAIAGRAGEPPQDIRRWVADSYTKDGARQRFGTIEVSIFYFTADGDACTAVLLNEKPSWRQTLYEAARHGTGKAPAGAAPKRPEDLSDQELAAEQARLEAELAKLVADLAKRLAEACAFVISGDVKDRDENQLVIWGVAVPDDGNSNRMGSLIQKGSIVVLHPDLAGLRGGAFYNSRHYYLEKRYGKNAFGADVPMYVFGDPPADIAAMRAQRKLLQQQLDGVAAVANARRRTAPTSAGGGTEAARTPRP